MTTTNPVSPAKKTKKKYDRAKKPVLFQMGNDSRWSMSIFYGEPDENGKRKIANFQSKDAVNSTTKPDPSYGIMKLKQDFAEQKLKEFHAYSEISHIIIYDKKDNTQHQRWTPAHGWKYVSSINPIKKDKKRYCLKITLKDNTEKFITVADGESEDDIVAVKNALITAAKSLKIDITRGQLFDNSTSPGTNIGFMTSYYRFL